MSKIDYQEIDQTAESLLESVADEHELEKFLAVIRAVCRKDRDVAEELFDVVERCLNEH